MVLLKHYVDLLVEIHTCIETESLLGGLDVLTVDPFIADKVDVAECTLEVAGTNVIGTNHVGFDKGDVTGQCIYLRCLDIMDVKDISLDEGTVAEFNLRICHEFHIG